MTSLAKFIKDFYKKVWLWLVISIASALALCSTDFFTWLGFSDNRWILGITFIAALSLLVQNICDMIRTYLWHKELIARIDHVSSKTLQELKRIVVSENRTFKVEQGRIAAHFCLSQNQKGYATFPHYLWKALQKKFPHGNL